MTKKGTSGPESRYRPHFVEEARQRCAEGATIQELAESWGVKEGTVNNWRREHPELKKAIAEGRAEAVRKRIEAAAAARDSAGDRPRRFKRIEIVYVRP